MVGPADGAEKRTFDVEEATGAVRIAVQPFPKAAMFALADLGHRSLFAQLVACLLSVRTRDEVSLVASRRLFAVAPTAAAVAAMTPDAIDALIGDVTFHEQKAHRIHRIAEEAEREHGGDLPCDRALLLALNGVGPKCANLALGISCGEPLISVDIHVHRVCNRWGIVATETPEETMVALRDVLPANLWIEINALLVPFGKHICTGLAPHCSTCPVLDMCRQVGVGQHR